MYELKCNAKQIANLKRRSAFPAKRYLGQTLATKTSLHPLQTQQLCHRQQDLPGWGRQEFFKTKQQNNPGLRHRQISELGKNFQDEI